LNRETAQLIAISARAADAEELCELLLAVYHLGQVAGEAAARKRPCQAPRSCNIAFLKGLFDSWKCPWISQL
jgi:hypothetical protein